MFLDLVRQALAWRMTFDERWNSEDCVAATRNVGGAIKDNDVSRRRPFLPSLMPKWNASQTGLLNGMENALLGYYCIKASRSHVLILCCSSVIVFKLMKNIVELCA